MRETSVFTPEQFWIPEFIMNPYPTYHMTAKGGSLK
jgi:hypothetical protein